jgi:hypothetical protein
MDPVESATILTVPGVVNRETEEDDSALEEVVAVTG